MVAFHLLVVADEPHLSHKLTRALEHEGFAVQAAADAASTLARIDAMPDGMIIDVDLPDGDGRDLCQALRVRGVDAPALFMIARETMSDPRVEVGALTEDDYLVKPFRLDEAVGRVRALLRRSRAAAPISYGTLRLDPVMRAVRGELGAVSLTPTEFRVLTTLAEQRGRIVPRSDLVRAAWPADVQVSDNSLDQYITRLRSKLRKVSTGAAIVTTRGVGYRLD